mmetsp:Transcript_58404/g.156335  ORF Transcript_58404/g.156335 Transcript_58404/m.156335 type:complete len:209 (-) Transcript_58404:1012-1638(-)
MVRMLHRFDQLKGSVQLVQLAEALEHRAVGHDVRDDAAVHHLLQQRWGPRDLAAARAGVDDRVVGHAGELRPEVLGQHLLVQSPDTVEALLVRKALENGAVNHRVDRRARALVCKHLAQQGVGRVRLLVGHERLNGATQGDAGRQDAVSAHVLPSLLHALDIADEAGGADDAAVGVGVEAVAAPCASVPAQEPRDEVAARGTDASLEG